MKPISKMMTIAAIAALPFAGAALADESADVAARQAAMKTLGGEMRTLTQMSRGQIDFDMDAAQASLAKMAEVSETVPALFEPQSQDAESEASDDIWSNWDDFVEKAEALQAAASENAGTVTDAESLGAALGAVGGTCGGCHRAYQL